MPYVLSLERPFDLVLLRFMAVHQLKEARPTHRSWQPYVYSPFGGIVAIVMGSILALASMPGDHVPRGALFRPGFWMCLRILFAPAISVCREPRSIIRAENILALIPVFRVLFDLVQGAYSLEEVESAEVNKAFLAMATFSVALCVGRWIKPWRMPKLVLRTAASQLSQGAPFALPYRSWVGTSCHRGSGAPERLQSSEFGQSPFGSA